MGPPLGGLMCLRRGAEGAWWGTPNSSGLGKRTSFTFVGAWEYGKGGHSTGVRVGYAHSREDGKSGMNHTFLGFVRQVEATKDEEHRKEAWMRRRLGPVGGRGATPSCSEYDLSGDRVVLRERLDAYSRVRPPGPLSLVVQLLCALCRRPRTHQFFLKKN